MWRWRSLSAGWRSGAESPLRRRAQLAESPFDARGGIGHVREGVAIGEQPEVDAAVVAQNPDRQPLIPGIERYHWEDIAHRNACEVEGLLRSRDVRDHE